MKDKIFLEIPTPAEWLSALLEVTHISKAKLSRAISCDRSQLSKWASGSEAIPLSQMLEVAGALSSDPAESTYAVALYSVNEIRKRVETRAKRLFQNTPLLGEQVAWRLKEMASRFAALDQLCERVATATRVAQYLTDAEFAIRVADGCWSKKNAQLIDRENVVRHLRFPVNRFVGFMMNLPNEFSEGCEVSQQFRQRLIDDLRSTAKQSRRGKFESLGRQHAIHMLARYGDEEDVQFVEDVKYSKDVFLRRMAMFGLFIRTGDEDIVEQLRSDLMKKNQMANAIVCFDAVHYGDVKLLCDGEMPSVWVNAEESVCQLVRTIEANGNEKQRLLSFERLSLIVENSGAAVLESKRVLASIRKLGGINEVFMDKTFAKGLVRYVGQLSQVVD